MSKRRQRRKGSLKVLKWLARDIVNSIEASILIDTINGIEVGPGELVALRKATKLAKEIGVRR